MPLSPGDKLGPYEILSAIGAGGMGEVYKARDTRLNRFVAVKLLPQEFSSDPGRLARFQHEAHAAGSLDHPGIVAVFDVGELEGQHYIVSEMVDGRTLRTLLAEGPMPTRKATDLAAQIADTIAAAHAAGIVHRDLKPENIMVTRDGRAKVLDFGLAKREVPGGQLSTVTALTDPGVVVGTVGYMSPEQVRSETVSPLSDIFSFGLVLHEMLSGRRAFQCATAAETMTAILREDPPELPVAVPLALRNLVAHCLEKEASARFQSAKDIAFALRSVSAATTPSGSVSYVAPKRRWQFAFAAILLCGLLATYVVARWVGPDHIDQSKLQFQPFVADPGLETTPRWSPRGDTIAYAAEVNGILQIHTRKPGSADSTQHTRHDFDCLAPFWSNDGTRLYYTTLDFGSRAEIWTVAVAGGEPQRLLEQAVFGALSSDSKTLAFVRCLSGESGCGVWLSSPPGAPPKRFPREPLASRQGFRHHFWMDFAPSGGLLGILTAPTGAAEFYLASQDGESCRLEWSLRRRVRTAAGISFSWLPDSSAVLMTERLGAGSASLDLVRSGRLSTLHRGEQSFLHPTVSPDGGKVCYTTANSGYDVYEVPVDGSPMRPLVATGFDERSPAWSPDGRQIAYGTSDAIHLHDRQAGTDRTLLSLGDPVSVMDLAFSPDGQRLAFRRLLPPDLAIYITNLAGDTPVPLWKDPDLSPQRGPVWSPDGRWIAYYGFRDGNSAIFKIRVGGNEKPVFLTAGTANRPLRWSPRGDWLACDVITGLNLVSPDGKQLRKVSDRHWETFGFSSDGRNLIGIRVSDTRRLLLASVDVSTGQEKVLGDLGPRPASFTTARILAELPFRGFSLAPDGKSFVTSVYRDNSDLWIMKGIDQHLSLWQKLWPWR